MKSCLKLHLRDNYRKALRDYEEFLKCVDEKIEYKDGSSLITINISDEDHLWCQSNEMLEFIAEHYLTILTLDIRYADVELCAWDGKDNHSTTISTELMGFLAGLGIGIVVHSKEGSV